MAIEYRRLVSNFLGFKCFPILKEFVLVDIYYKMIPVSNEVGIQRRLDHSSPEVIFDSETKPFKLTYLVGESTLSVHEMETLDTSGYEKKCIKVKISRRLIETTLNITCGSLEEELYHFIAHLNFNLPKIRQLLNLSFAQSTRFIPIHLHTWVYYYEKEAIPTSEVVIPIDHFGPEARVPLSVRLVDGCLSASTSKDGLLSLNDPLGWTDHVPTEWIHRYHPFNMYYSTKWKAMLPLAYNPLENPIVG